MERITINCKITAQDYKKVTFFGAFGKNKMMKFLMYIAFPIGILQIIEAIYSKTILYPFTFYSSLAMFGLMGVMVLVVNWDVNRFIKNQKVTLDTIRTIYIDDRGISSLQPDLSQVTYGYDTFIDAYEINGFFIVYVNQLSGVILAKRDIKEEDIPKIREVFKEKFQKKFKIRGVK